MRFYDMSVHSGAMADASTLLENSVSVASGITPAHQVFLCNCRGAEGNTRAASINYHYNFSVCPRSVDLECGWNYPYSHDRADRNVRNYGQDPHFQQVDALLFPFSKI